MCKLFGYHDIPMAWKMIVGKRFLWKIMWALMQVTAKALNDFEVLRVKRIFDVWL